RGRAPERPRAAAAVRPGQARPAPPPDAVGRLVGRRLHHRRALATADRPRRTQRRDTTRGTGFAAQPLPPVDRGAARAGKLLSDPRLAAGKALVRARWSHRDDPSE